MSLIRLDKYLADAGQGTRSQVKLLVKQGRVKVDGQPVKKVDIKVDTATSTVSVDGEELSYNDFEYFMLNKPKGVVSATKDNLHKTVVELLTEDKRRDLFPVGRLDIDTEGLLLLTNDGKLANNLLAPGKHVTKTYFATVLGDVTEETVRYFKDGLDIGDEKRTATAKLIVVEKKEDEDGNIISDIKLDITEGRFHQVKRMFEAVDMEVLYLKRLSMGLLVLDDSLELGEYRKLTEEEITLLKQ